MIHLPVERGWLPELIALDIDDTLVPHMGQVSERVIDALARAQEAGITIALATGRTLSTTAPIARAAGLDGWVVCSNGAVLATVEPETVVETFTFDPTPAITHLQELVPDAVFAVEDIHGIFHTTKMFGAGALGLSIREVPFEHLLAEPVVRLVVRSREHREEGFGRVAEQLGYHSVFFGVGDVAWMDVGAKGVNKGSALARLCTQLDLNQGKTLAIGDFYNDVEMLRWATVGVAMGSADETVKAAADAVTSAEPGEGVAQVIDALLA
jgi:HAD superfamily hydrolase (TIGR01484 family)